MCNAPLFSAIIDPKGKISQPKNRNYWLQMASHKYHLALNLNVYFSDNRLVNKNGVRRRQTGGTHRSRSASAQGKKLINLLPQICTVILRIHIGKVAWFAVYICGNFWVTQYHIPRICTNKIPDSWVLRIRNGSEKNQTFLPSFRLLFFPPLII